MSDTKGGVHLAKTQKPTEEVVKKGLTTTHKIMIAGFSVLIIVIVVAAVLILSGREKELPPEEANQVVTLDNFEEIMLENEEKVADGYFETWMITTWTFPDGKSPASLAIMGNSPANQYPFYFELYLKDTGELVYTSGLIPVGNELKEIQLDVELPKGEYEASATIRMVKDDEEIDSNMSIGVDLIIEN